MGANVSTNVSDTLQSTITNVTTQFLNSYSQTTESTSSITQNFILNVIGDARCDNLGVNQFASSTMGSIAQLQNNMTADFQNQLENQLSTAIDEMTKQKNSGLNLGQTNVSSNVNKVKNFITNNISSVVKNSISSVLSNYSATSQNITVNIGGSLFAQNCTFTQESTVKMIAQNASSNMMSLLESNSVTNKALTDLQMTADQSNVGLSLLDFLGPILIILVIMGVMFFGGEQFIAKYYVLIFSIALILLLIGIGYFTFKKLWIPDAVSGAAFVGILGYFIYKYRSSKRSGGGGVSGISGKPIAKTN